MKNYEMLCVLPGTLAEDEVIPIVEEISKALGTYEAQNVSVEDMGKSRLAYPIKHIRYGYFQLFRFELEPENLDKLEKSVRLLGDLLRVVVGKYNPSKVGAYKLAQDPNALSAPKKEESRGRFPKKEHKRPKTKEEPKVKEVEEKIEEKEESVNSSETQTVVTEETIEETKPVEFSKPEEKKSKVKISVDDIDKKLDEILQQDIDKV